MRRLLSLLKKIFRICDHEFIFMETVQDRNLRTGHAHWSNVYSCMKCGKYETQELDL